MNEHVEFTLVMIRQKRQKFLGWAKTTPNSDAVEYYKAEAHRLDKLANSLHCEFKGGE